MDGSSRSYFYSRTLDADNGYSVKLGEQADHWFLVEFWHRSRGL
ncbi:hypothetical protein NicSoilE8_42750 (plasmid) [Arthrobacter sp. NicSoilE8]|nr:hypothetical protein NicSoilE8_42750 [Arthrobacter sp. NicSoilE8]